MDVPSKLIQHSACFSTPSLLTHLVVFPSVGLGSLGVELDGGEATDVESIDLVTSTVHLGDDDIIVVSKVLAKLGVDGVELLAVSAPISPSVSTNIAHVERPQAVLNPQQQSN